jgi:plastocyanin
VPEFCKRILRSHVNLTHFQLVLSGILMMLSFFSVPQAAIAQRIWNANVGAETKDEAGQANAFLPNEVWINAGDKIQWTWQPRNEPHTVTFLKAGQTRPTPPPPIGPPSGPPVGPPFFFGSSTPPFVECPSPNPYNGGTATYDGSACVSSAALTSGAAPSTFTVTFPNPGNYKLVCLIHSNMNGTVHVLDKNAPLPYMQFDYDRQARDQAEDILKDADNPKEEQRDFRRSQKEVIMTGEVVATGGGRQALSISRFFNGTIYVHVGETVEWTNLDPTEPHTVTFGTEPANPMATVGATAAADGALQGTISSTSDSVSSGFLQAAPEDAAGRGQAAPGTTRIRIKFNHAGTYHYICALHDVNGMVGTVIVK